MRRLLATALALAVPLLGGVAGAQSSSYERVVDVTFPVAGSVRYSNDYHQARGGGSRVHQATDLLGAKLQALHATVDGEICYINGVDEPMPSWGYSLTLCGDDGLEYHYIHINNDNPGTDDGAGGVQWAYADEAREGRRVARGQFLAYMGDSGNGEDTTPHLHFEMYDDELEDPALANPPYKQGRLNPFPSLESARQRGDLPGSSDRSPTPTPSSPPSQQPSPAPSNSPAPPPPPSPQPAAPPSPEPAPASPEPSPEPPPASSVRRLAGPDRIATAAALAGERDAARVVIIVPSSTPAEALVAAPLAGLLDAPVLLTGPAGLDPVVASQIERLGARSAYVVGRTDQLSRQVEADLAEAGITAQARLEEPDVFALSAAVAREMAGYGTGRQSQAFDQVLLALGSAADSSRAWPDALSASALAAQLQVPILLTRPDELPAAVGEVLAELEPKQVTVIGGTVAISDDIAAAAADRARADEVLRLAGENRYGTSASVADVGRAAGLDAPVIWVATGLNFPDALAAGPAAAAANAPLLLVHGQTVGGSPESDGWLSGHKPERVVVVGGQAAVSDPVSTALARAVAP